MPLFSITNGKLQHVEQMNFQVEKSLQDLIEKNLQPVFNCRFVASEFPTGPMHAGRIDTLALSEDDNPVIIEYKKAESSELINQGLYYLAWMHDHRGDFEVAARKALGDAVVIDWSNIRVICIAPGYKKFDLYAVQVMGAGIELWTYRMFENKTLFLEEIVQKAFVSPTDQAPAVKPSGIPQPGNGTMVVQPTKHTFERHITSKPEAMRRIALAIQEFVTGLDSAMREVPRQDYIAYKIAQNIMCMEVHKAKVYLYLKLDPKAIGVLPAFARDVTEIGHFGTGDLELTLSSFDDVEKAKPFIVQAYERFGR